jgi:hypothetical protein
MVSKAPPSPAKRIGTLCAAAGALGAVILDIAAKLVRLSIEVFSAPVV